MLATLPTIRGFFNKNLLGELLITKTNKAVLGSANSSFFFRRT